MLNGHPLLVIPPPLKSVPKERKKQGVKVAWLEDLQNMLNKAVTKFISIAAIFPPLKTEAKEFYSTWTEDIEQIVATINSKEKRKAVKIIDLKKEEVEDEQMMEGDQITLMAVRKIVIQGFNAVSKSKAEGCKDCGGYVGHIQCPAKEPKRRPEDQGDDTIKKASKTTPLCTR